MREITSLRTQVDSWEKLYARISDSKELLEMEDDEMLEDLSKEIVLLVKEVGELEFQTLFACLLYTSPSPRDGLLSRMPSSA